MDSVNQTRPTSLNISCIRVKLTWGHPGRRPHVTTEDALMIVVMVLFVLEMLINGIVDYKTYPLCLGFRELRWFQGKADENDENDERTLRIKK